MEMTLDQNPTHKEGRPLEVAKLFVRNETKVGNLNQPVETLIHLRWRGNALLVVHTDDPNILDTAPLQTILMLFKGKRRVKTMKVDCEPLLLPRVVDYSFIFTKISVDIQI